MNMKKLSTKYERTEFALRWPSEGFSAKSSIPKPMASNQSVMSTSFY
jgi:hypothetical protein